MMGETSSLEDFLKTYDPVDTLSMARVARCEQRLLERIAATPQGMYLRPERSVFTDVVVPLWKSALMTVLLLGLGAYTGMAFTSFTRVSDRQEVAAETQSTHSVTVFAMAAPWQVIVDR